MSKILYRNQFLYRHVVNNYQTPLYKHKYRCNVPNNHGRNESRMMFQNNHVHSKEHLKRTILYLTRGSSIFSCVIVIFLSCFKSPALFLKGHRKKTAFPTLVLLRHGIFCNTFSEGGCCTPSEFSIISVLLPLCLFSMYSYESSLTIDGAISKL